MGLMATTLALSAQTPLEKQLTRDTKPGPKQFGEVSDTDKRLVVNKVAHQLTKLVRFRNDGIAASYFDGANGRQQIEWIDLRIKMLIPLRINEADQKSGISKRIQALLTYDACRQFDAKTHSWGAWGKKAHPLFPAAITIEWKNGHPIPNAGIYAGKFKPGPSVSPGQVTTGPAVRPGGPRTLPGTKPSTGGGISRPSGNNNGLPPGMTPK